MSELKVCYKCGAPILTNQEHLIYEKLPLSVKELENYLIQIGETWSNQHIRTVLRRMEKKGLIVEIGKTQNNKVFDIV